MNTNAIQIKKKKQNKNKREGWKNIKLLSSTIFLFFLFMKKKWQKKIVSAKIIRINVCLWGVQRLKELSFEHNCHSYTYSKKKKSYHILEKRNIFFLGWKVSRKHSPFENFYFIFWKLFIQRGKNISFFENMVFGKKRRWIQRGRNIIFLEENNFLACHFRISKEKKENEIFIFDVFFIFIFFRFIYFWNLIFERKAFF